MMSYQPRLTPCKSMLLLTNSFSHGTSSRIQPKKPARYCIQGWEKSIGTNWLISWLMEWSQVQLCQKVRPSWWFKILHTKHYNILSIANLSFMSNFEELCSGFFVPLACRSILHLQLQTVDNASYFPQEWDKFKNGPQSRWEKNHSALQREKSGPLRQAIFPWKKSTHSLICCRNTGESAE